MDKRLIEMLMGLTVGQNREQVFGEIVELLDDDPKKRIYEYLRIKTLASLRSQAATIEDAIKRYGND